MLIDDLSFLLALVHALGEEFLGHGVAKLHLIMLETVEEAAVANLLNQSVLVLTSFLNPDRESESPVDRHKARNAAKDESELVEDFMEDQILVDLLVTLALPYDGFEHEFNDKVDKC